MDKQQRQQRISNARVTLEQRWDAQGGCQSCGWHAQLSRHDVCDFDLELALNFDYGILKLGCLNPGDDRAWNHRGVRVDLNP